MQQVIRHLVLAHLRQYPAQQRRADEAGAQFIPAKVQQPHQFSMRSFRVIGQPEIQRQNLRRLRIHRTAARRCKILLLQVR